MFNLATKCHQPAALFPKNVWICPEKSERVNLYLKLFIFKEEPIKWESVQSSTERCS